MKYLACIFLFFITISASSQNNHIVKTEDGRRVLLKADFTWEYIDLVAPKDPSPKTTIAETKDNTCHVQPGFEEPKLNQKIQNQLKKGRATIKHIKQKVANDYECTVDDVILLYAKEIKKTGTYKFCANGTVVTYKRVGNNIAKKIEIF